MLPRSRQRQRAAVTVALALMACAALIGQTFYGTIVGVVYDAGGAVIPAVSVTLTNTGTGATQQVETSGEGGYRFVNLLPGTYRLEAELEGFRRFSQENIRVEVESTVRVEISLEIGQVSEVVEVTSAPPLLQTENATMSQVVSERAVQEMPLNGRNVLNLVSLAPGVVPQGNSQTSLTGKNVFAAGNYQIGGGTANQSATYIDGAPVNIAYGNMVALVPSQDSVSEFRVQTSNNSAEWGRYTGGVINMASKSGTNEFHGSAYEFIRNEKLNANDFFANATSAGKGPFKQNQFGANIGGPIFKDKTFFFGSYEGYRQRFARLTFTTVPTEAMRVGDFSQDLTSSGALVTLYDPLTNCGTGSNPACSSEQSVVRDPFVNNQIPTSRVGVAANKYVAFPFWAHPNTPGRQFTNQQNYTNQTSDGGDNDQTSIRIDHAQSDNNRIFARWTRWDSANVSPDPYQNGVITGAPEFFTTNQIVFGDTYMMSPTMIFDLRLSFLRWNYERVPGYVGIDITTLGLPAYFNSLPDRTVPRVNTAGYATGGTGVIWSRNNNYQISPTLTKISGSHTLKVGAELRRLDFNYWQNNDAGGIFNFNNLFTSRNARSPGATGNSFASFLLGYGSDGYADDTPATANSMRYQGYFINDTWQVTPKLTMNLGLRYEIPGVFTERFDRLTNFDPDAIHPIVNSPGRFVLVNSPEHPERGNHPETYTQFAPRVGIAYRLTDSTVIRTGAGRFNIPSDTAFWEAAYGHTINQYRNPWVSTQDDSVTPFNTFSNPFPDGLVTAPQREPRYEAALLGLSARAPLKDAKFGYTWQWNFSIGHEFKGVALEAGYAGMRGYRLPSGGWQQNQINPVHLDLAGNLRNQVTNPFYGVIENGLLRQPTVQLGQLLRPYAHYDSVNDSGGRVGDSSYHSLQLKAEKRLPSGGRILGAYTFSKILTNIESNTNWLEGGQTAGFQNAFDLQSEKSLTSFDSRHRMVLSYVLDLPFGKAQRFGTNASGLVGALISGWGVNGISTFQAGFPARMEASPNLTGFNTGLRPNVVQGCDPVIGGTAQSKLESWWNKDCYTVPDPYTFGDLSRTDPRVRTHGIANFDFAVFKRTSITEDINLEFRTEFFNLFNRVQFGRPNQTLTTAANNTFGRVTSQLNDPRLIQFSLRLNF